MEPEKQHTRDETKLIPIGGSWGIILTKYFREYLNLEVNDEIIIQDDVRKDGKRFVSFWKKGC